jgi:hypothetical protein
MKTRWIRTGLCVVLIAALAWHGLQQTQAVRSNATHGATAAGTVIAFVKSSRNGQAIGLINPDGSNERELWRLPQAMPASRGIGFLAWNPSATELAFDSGHISASLTIRDLYAVKPDGTGLRRITNAPHPASLAALPKGEVAIGAVSTGSEGRILQVYVEGAPAPYVWEAPGSASRDFSFPSVADYGSEVRQYAVIKDGDLCYYNLVAYADVQPGQIVRSAANLIAGAVTGTFRCPQPYRATWTADGSRLGFLVYRQIGSSPQNDIWISPAVNVPLGNKGQEVRSIPPSGDNAKINLLAFGPTANRANEMLYDFQTLPEFSQQKIPVIYKAPIDEPVLAEQVDINLEEPCPLINTQATFCQMYGLAWLPDGSGFVFSLIQRDAIDSSKDVNYLYRHSLVTGATTRIAALGKGIVTDVTVSPDMQKLAYARAEAFGAPSDIWVIGMDGSNPQKIVSDARDPKWSPRVPSVGTQPTPTPTATPTSGGPTPTRNPNLVTQANLPLVSKQAQAAPTATPVGQPTTTPSPSANLINGNFDLGRGVGWAEYSPTGSAIISASTSFFVKPRSGTHVALFMFGSADGGVREISQTVQLPATATDLTFYYRWDSQDQTCSADVARAFVGVGGSRQPVWSKVLCSQDYEGASWFPVTVSLASYAGQSVAVVFQLQTNTTGHSTFAIDDVALSTGSSAPTPTPTSTPPPNATATATPATPAATPTTSTSGGITGKVTYNGIGIGNITVRLVRCVPQSNSCTIAQTITTNASGNYLFTGVPALRTPEIYFVGYQNGLDGGNTDNPNYLAYWRSFNITSYAAGASADGGSFDIADIKLNTPPHNASLGAPITFSWSGRGIAGEAFAWGLYSTNELINYEVCNSGALSSTTFVATEALAGQCLIYFNVVYNWYAYVGKADGSAYGRSYNVRNITVKPPTS